MNIEELMYDKEFNEQVEKAANAEEVVSLFASRGIEVPLGIAQELFHQPESELNESELENVAGGKACPFIGYLYWRFKGYDKKTSWQMGWDVHKNGADGQGNRAK